MTNIGTIVFIAIYTQYFEIVGNTIYHLEWVILANFYFIVFPGEEVLTHVQVTGLRHSIMICQVTCTAVQRGKVSFLC